MDAEWREYACAYCGEINETCIDPSSGSKQSYVEDCRICCRPNVLSVHIDSDTGAISIEAVIES
jgi:hypothetical protein